MLKLLFVLLLALFSLAKPLGDSDAIRDELIDDKKRQTPRDYAKKLKFKAYSLYSKAARKQSQKKKTPPAKEKISDNLAYDDYI